MKFEILKGSEKDFEGAPDWATQCVWNDFGWEFFSYWLNPETKLVQLSWMAYPNSWTGHYGWGKYIKAERRIIAEPQPDAEGWIEWKGGECPVEKGTLVDAKYRNGNEKHNLLPLVTGCASGPFWRRDGNGGDIIAYRLSKSERPEETTSTAWNGEGLPPVGVECQIISHELENDNQFSRVVVIAYGKENVFLRNIKTGDEFTQNLRNILLRPIPFPGGIESGNAYEELVQIEKSMPECYQPHELINAIVQAGYRRIT